MSSKSVQVCAWATDTCDGTEARNAGEDDPALRVLGAHGRLLEALVHQVHQEAGLAKLEPTRVALFVAMGMVDAQPEDLEAAITASRDGAGRFDASRYFARGYRHLHPLWPLAMLGNVAIGQLSIDLGIRGDNAVFGSDGAAGVRAMLEGMASLQEGRADAALVAAVSETSSPFATARRRVEAPEQAFAVGAVALVLRADATSGGLRLHGGLTGFRPPAQTAPDGPTPNYGAADPLLRFVAHAEGKRSAGTFEIRHSDPCGTHGLLLGSLADEGHDK